MCYRKSQFEGDGKINDLQNKQVNDKIDNETNAKDPNTEGCLINMFLNTEDISKHLMKERIKISGI